MEERHGRYITEKRVTFKGTKQQAIQKAIRPPLCGCSSSRRATAAGTSAVEITLNIYPHVLPSTQGDAASRLAVFLHG